MAGLVRMAGPEVGVIGAGAALDGAVQCRGLRLEGDVHDAEPLAEEGGEVGEDVFGAACVVELDVSGERGEGRRDAPDVDVVEGDDAADVLSGFGNGGGIEAGGRTFEEDRGGLAEEVDGAGDDERGDEEGRQGIDEGRGAERDGEGGGDDEDGAEGVGERLEGRAPDVEVVVCVPVQDAKDEDVDGEADDGGKEDGSGGDMVTAVEALQRFVDDEARDGCEEGNVERDGEDFGAGVAEGAAGIGRASGDGGGTEGECEAEAIGEHVARIGNEGDGAEGEADSELSDGEEDGEAKASKKRPAPGEMAAHTLMVAPGGDGAGTRFPWPSAPTER